MERIFYVKYWESLYKKYMLFIKGSILKVRLLLMFENYFKTSIVEYIEG